MTGAGAGAGAETGGFGRGDEPGAAGLAIVVRGVDAIPLVLVWPDGALLGLLAGSSRRGAAVGRKDLDPPPPVLVSGKGRGRLWARMLVLRCRFWGALPGADE